MKRIATLLLVAVMMLSMTALPATAQEDPPSSPDTESPAPSGYEGLEDWIDWWLWFLGAEEPE